MNDNVVIINDFSTLEQRTTKTGKVRFTIAVKSEPLAFNLDERALAKPVAQAMAQHLRAAVQGIGEKAAPATLKARKVAAKALTEGKAWAMQRYIAARAGNGPPNQTDRKFNDSGLFARSIVVGTASDGAYRVNVAANRLSGPDAPRIWERLVALVPEFAKPSLMMANDIVRKAHENAARQVVTKGQMGASGWDLLRAVVDLAEQVL